MYGRRGATNRQSRTIGQIFGPSLGSPAAIVTPQGELLTTGSVVTQGTDTNLFQVVGKLDEILNQIKITNTQLELITNTTIKEVEI